VLDLTEYIIKGNLRLKYLTLENYVITKICSKKIELHMNTFRNVIFENHYEGNYIVIKKCTFVNCSFHDAFGNDSHLEMKDCVFHDCLFENVSMDIKGEISTILNLQFVNCTFKNMNIKGSLEISYLDVNEGVMEHIDCLGNDISSSQFSNLTLKNLNLNLALFHNKFESVIFQSVTLKGCMRLECENENEFLQCDTRGFKFIEGS
jgi:uncharacterized protein YjbI with pentapeptide repeats